MYKQYMVLLVPWSAKLWMNLINLINLKVKKRGPGTEIDFGPYFSR